MAEGRDCKEWDIAASLLALQANCNISKKSRPYSVEYFHPYRNPKNPAKQRENRNLAVSEAVAGNRAVIRKLRYKGI